MDDFDDIIDLDSPLAHRQMRERHIRIGKRMQAIGMLALAEIERRVQAGELVLSTEDALELVRAGAEMRRLAQDKPDDDAPIPPDSKPN